MDKIRCKKCNELKNKNQFPKSNLTKLGIVQTCRACARVMKANRINFIPNENSGTKLCPNCKKTLPINRFRVSQKSKTGRYWMCEDCYRYHNDLNRGMDKNYFRKLRIKISKEYRDEINKLSNKSRLNNFERFMWSAAKKRAKAKGIEFSIKISDIVIPSVCPILEVPFEYGTKDNYEYTPSLDRIDNSKGYTKDNILVMSKKANSMKNNASWDEIKRFCANIIRYSPNNTEKEGIEVEDKEPLR